MKVDKDFIPSTFRTPNYKKNNSVNNSLEYSLKIHSVKFSPGKKSKLSTSPPMNNKTFTDFKQNTLQAYNPMRSRVGNKQRLQLPVPFRTKPCSISPRRMANIPKLKFPDDEDNHPIHKPYAPVNNGRTR